ncbi:hypothetical protein BJ970_006317 [Saccharopolyspora phatthalungensis]|uniref:Uncharacterized protein n=1 Tax=Saccharopolyspora phatthalungensis TaxID=664693 RepID=A0A840QIK4_9PSEU|nr:hypothetical protein [Saccharopolyspora phatthalungensis]
MSMIQRTASCDLTGTRAAAQDELPGGLYGMQMTLSPEPPERLEARRHEFCVDCASRFLTRPFDEWESVESRTIAPETQTQARRKNQRRKGNRPARRGCGEACVGRLAPP